MVDQANAAELAKNRISADLVAARGAQSMAAENSSKALAKRAKRAKRARRARRARQASQVRLSLIHI